MSSIPIILSIAFASAWLYSLIEVFAVQYFQPFFFKTGLVALWRTLNFPENHFHITEQQTIEKDTGKFRFTTDGLVYFRPRLKWFEFEIRTPFPFKCIGKIVDGSQVDVVARIPLGNTLFMLCAIIFVMFFRFAEMSTLVLPAIFIFLAVMIGVSYWVESRRMEKMLRELEQIGWELDRGKISLL